MILRKDLRRYCLECTSRSQDTHADHADSSGTLEALKVVQDRVALRSEANVKAQPCAIRLNVQMSIANTNFYCPATVPRRGSKNFPKSSGKVWRLGYIWCLSSHLLGLSEVGLSRAGRPVRRMTWRDACRNRVRRRSNSRRRQCVSLRAERAFLVLHLPGGVNGCLAAIRAMRFQIRGKFG